MVTMAAMRMAATATAARMPTTKTAARMTAAMIVRRWCNDRVPAKTTARTNPRIITNQMAASILGHWMRQWRPVHPPMKKPKSKSTKKPTKAAKAANIKISNRWLRRNLAARRMALRIRASQIRRMQQLVNQMHRVRETGQNWKRKRKQKHKQTHKHKHKQKQKQRTLTRMIQQPNLARPRTKMPRRSILVRVLARAMISANL
mmetsp:Transcript_4082/g.11614  ORF Transcript_4082/g.11614 Transcript_4082/m.11614 type:complete len:203 (+) Transcript_4082:1575-2183(+)